MVGILLKSIITSINSINDISIIKNKRTSSKNHSQNCASYSLTFFHVKKKKKGIQT